MDLQDIATAPKIVQRQAEHALAAALADSKRHGQIRDIVIGTWHGRYLGEVVTLTRGDADPTSEDIAADVYAVEVRGRRGGTDETMWTTVVHGASDRMHFSGDAARWTAVLHAIAQIHGGPDSHATASFYAGRVLGLPEATP